MLSESGLFIVNRIAHGELTVHRNDEVLADVTGIKFSTKLEDLHASCVHSDVFANEILRFVIRWCTFFRRPHVRNGRPAHSCKGLHQNHIGIDHRGSKANREPSVLGKFSFKTYSAYLRIINELHGEWINQ